MLLITRREDSLVIAAMVVALCRLLKSDNRPHEGVNIACWSGMSNGMWCHVHVEDFESRPCDIANTASSIAESDTCTVQYLHMQSELDLMIVGIVRCDAETMALVLWIR